MRGGSFDSTFLSEVKIGTLRTLEQSPSNGHSYKNITGTLPTKLEQYDTQSESSCLASTLAQGLLRWNKDDRDQKKKPTEVGLSFNSPIYSFSKLL